MMALGPKQGLAWALVVRRWRRSFSTACNGAGSGRQRILFLGTPQVAAIVLEELFKAAALPGSNFEVAAVVSRPSSKHWLAPRDEQQQQQFPAAQPCAASAPSAASPWSAAGSSSAFSGSPAAGFSAGCSGGSAARSPPGAAAGSPPPPAPNWSRHSASPVERLALQYGIPADRILCPVSAKEPSFLEAVRRLRPALAVTAAYGAMLPQAFLDIPKYGTLNIHPSLLPRYRGAAPVQRALQDGCTRTGVSLVFTVMKCDAGPVLEQQPAPIPPHVQAPELSEHLFRVGAAMLLRQLPRVLAGEVTAADAAVQDEAEASYAPKIVKQEAYLDFRRSALEVHNHVRAMAGWPGSRASLLVEDRATGTRDPLELKVLRTAVVPGQPHQPPPHQSPRQQQQHSAPPPLLPPGTSGQMLCTPGGELLVPCGDGNMLSILEVGRRPGSGSTAKFLTAREFIEGLGRRRLFLPSRT